MIAAKYYLYRNLHTGGFSIKLRGIVVDRIAHDASIIVDDATFKINEQGRRRVIYENRKNVHAYAVFDKYKSSKREVVDNLASISYNPYKLASFVCNGASISRADRVLFQDGKSYLLT